MKNVNNYFLGILVVCLLSGIFLLLSIFALQDIYSGSGAEFTSEWNLVKLNYVVTGLLYLFIIYTFFKFRNSLKNSR